MSTVERAATLAVAVGRDLREHWVLAFRALATALVAGYTCGELLDGLPLQRRVVELGTPLFGDWRSALIVVGMHEFVVCAVAGWAVALTHRSHRATMVLLYSTAVLGFHACWSLLNLVHGWGTPGNVRLLLLYHGFTAIMLAGALTGGFAPFAAVPQKSRG
jgi:cytochrome bd-type quinol oxidase subunit 2